MSDFWLTGARHYRNADRVVHLYNYLLAGARKASRDTDEPRLVDTQATAESELVGPFQVRIPLMLNVTDGHVLVDADGFATRRHHPTAAPTSTYVQHLAPRQQQ